MRSVILLAVFVMAVLAKPAHAHKFHMTCQSETHHVYTVDADDVALTFVVRSIDGSKVGVYKITAIENDPSNLVISGLTNDGGPPFKAQFRPKPQMVYELGKMAGNDTDTQGR